MVMSTRISTCIVKLRRWRRALRRRHLIPKINFITIHYAYFILSGLIASLLLWGSATPFGSLNYTDALFLAVSAMTEAGLNTVNLSSLNTFQQVVLFLLMIIGSAIFVSAFVILVRLKAFEKEFVHVVRSAQHSAIPSLHNSPELGAADNSRRLGHISFPPVQGEFELSNSIGRAAPSTVVANIAEQHGVLPKSGSAPLSRSSHTASSSIASSIDLTNAEREELGGDEYKAVRLLSWLVPLYFVLWQLLSCISCGWWVAAHRAALTRANGIGPWWTGVFNAVSAFNNNGMSLLDANMTAFQDAYFLLITMGLLILAGNTAYPIFLRSIVWGGWKLLPNSMSDTKQTLRFLLDHPRRCYTNLFPSQHTWWLAMSIICLNGVDWAAFEILNIGNDEITQLNGGIEVIDGLFQALAVRSGGFYVVAIPKIRISLQVLYVLMMYVSVYPVAISMRNSNVYEERSLGIFAPIEDLENVEDKSKRDLLLRRRSTFTTLSRVQSAGGKIGRAFFVRQQVRAQLADDLIWIVLAIFVIMIIEGSQFERDPVNFSVFNVIFECVSAYGTVGISVGVPYDNFSFCGSWHKLSKLVLIAVMIKGRHRGLPRAIDRAVQLPGRDHAGALAARHHHPLPHPDG